MHTISSNLNQSNDENLQREAQPESVVLQVSPNDIYWAGRAGLNNPMLLSLQRATGTLWHLYPDGLALEIMTPYRACHCPEAFYLSCADWEKLLEDGCCELQVELQCTEETEGYSLIQRRARKS
jgi:hypothetical protein